jgi:hypothetical protein
LPTSLTYILLSTRGCSPRRPDAVMSTTGRAINLSVGFSRAIESAPDTQEAACSAWATPLSPGNQIPGRAARVKKKRELFPGLALASPTSLMSPYNIHVPVREYEPDSLSGPAGPEIRPVADR